MCKYEIQEIENYLKGNINNLYMPEKTSKKCWEEELKKEKLRLQEMENKTFI